MLPICPQCRQDNPPGSRFCGACGLALPVDARRRTFHQNRGGLFIAAVIIVVWLVAAGPSHVIPKVVNIWPRVLQKVFHGSSSRSIDLDEAKSRELYRLLAPQDIHMIVSLNSGHLSVSGTEQEVDALVGLAEMLARTRHRGGGLSGSVPPAPQKRTRRTYHLPRERAQLLRELLRDADLPLDLCGPGDAFSIGASEKDHAILDQVVAILNGERL
ncbi:MAG: zinc ribbon domain-containing protein [Phycisphaerae bacterium]